MLEFWPVPPFWELGTQSLQRLWLVVVVIRPIPVRVLQDALAYSSASTKEVESPGITSRGLGCKPARKRQRSPKVYKPDYEYRNDKRLLLFQAALDVEINLARESSSRHSQR